MTVLGVWLLSAPPPSPLVFRARCTSLSPWLPPWCEESPPASLEPAQSYPEHTGEGGGGGEGEGGGGGQRGRGEGEGEGEGRVKGEGERRGGEEGRGGGEGEGGTDTQILSFT